MGVCYFSPKLMKISTRHPQRNYQLWISFPEASLAFELLSPVMGYSLLRFSKIACCYTNCMDFSKVLIIYLNKGVHIFVTAVLLTTHVEPTP